MDHFCYLCFVFVMHCIFVVTCWERVNLLALLYVMFSYVFVTFQCDVLAQMWHFIVSIPDRCLLTYFNKYQTLENWIMVDFYAFLKI